MCLLSTALFAQSPPLPIIDMHVHANHADFTGIVPMTICVHNEKWPTVAAGSDWAETLIQASQNCDYPLVSPPTDEEVMNQSLAIMKKWNIYSVTSGRLTEVWKDAAPERIISSFYYRGDGLDPSPDSLRSLFEKGIFEVLGEIATQYNGISPDDPSLEPYWAFAEALNIPVGIHIGPSPIGAAYLGWGKNRGRLHSPLQLEEVLVRHPKLRLYVMHAGWPMIDELLTLLWNHPQVYVDISGIITDLNEPAFYDYLKKIILVGFGDRIMYGSDQMIWPQLMEISIQTIESAPFLSTTEKRDILYNNAARFLQLSEEEIRRHHGQ